jgi:para-aminobenzoate synthetase component 1
LLCLSPERFFQIRGNQLISQPIKGTIKRGASESEDLALKEALLQSPKERNENVMIVDLVRNDLSQMATKGSVKVDELYGIYTFPKLHHMISTVSCILPENHNAASTFQSIFPMGSMTGVPKRKAVDLMHQYEKSARGWYSGSVGFIEPNGNADFNVIIRSIHYNQKINLAKIGIGSAITLQSDPQSEWKECWLKAQSLIQPLA